MKVLVTGADGFIGSHLVEELVNEGYQVKAFCYYNSFNSWGWLDSFLKKLLDEIEIFSGDVRDPNGVRTAMKGIDEVFHLAALIAIPYSYHSPDSYIDTNVKGALNILQAARDVKVVAITLQTVPPISLHTVPVISLQTVPLSIMNNIVLALLKKQYQHGRKQKKHYGYQTSITTQTKRI